MLVFSTHCVAVTFFFMVACVSADENIRVGTYNLWNVMFNWGVRQHRIAEMILDAQPDIIGFQEVRGHKTGERNQVADLKSLLPEYRWMRHHPTNYVQKVNGSFLPGWETEGLGLLSKWPILKSRVHVLSSANTGDSNKRVSLSAQIAVNERVIVNVVVVHFSYDRQQQCQNAAEVLKHLTDLKLPNAVILGDFNTYTDFEWSAKVLTSTNRLKEELGPCYSTATSIIPKERIILEIADIWEATADSDHFSFTFSNMPTPGLHSRPDRVLASSVFKPTSLFLVGSGDAYEKRYHHSIVLDRFWTIVSQAGNSYAGLQGYPCLHDCGPHGSCRCGVCVGGGNTNTCLLPNCKECSSTLFRNLVIYGFMLAICLVHLLYAAVLVLNRSVRRHGRTIRQIFGCNCCLCNPSLYSGMSFPRNVGWRSSKLQRLWPCLRMPPMVFFMIFLTFSLLMFYIGKHLVFSEMLNTTYSIMNEELYPSDHLMVIADLHVEI
ncbi:uncharacterized protein LOC135471533 [Liolophura sinensis]|uniref:uncharacterized protein LOC135471533 n=1 Tax=Liolophura sinensis TaxID=3198878 RepID=UPI00315871AA